MSTNTLGSLRSLVQDPGHGQATPAPTFLYRLLFVLFAEDRHLLPARDPRYDDYSLHRIRLDVAERRDAADTFSTAADRYYHDLQTLFRAVGEGDSSLGVPPYDGGLFARSLRGRTARPRARVLRCGSEA